MKHYFITVMVDLPYPKTFTFRVAASNFAVATGKALRIFRKELPKKKIKKLNIKVVQM